MAPMVRLSRLRTCSARRWAANAAENLHALTPSVSERQSRDFFFDFLKIVILPHITPGHGGWGVALVRAMPGRNSTKPTGHAALDARTPQALSPQRLQSNNDFNPLNCQVVSQKRYSS